MHAHEPGKAYVVLALNTIAFTVCFACGMLNGVLVTFLVENQVFHFTDSQIGWLMGIPVLSGSIIRLPVGILTDKYGGKWVYAAVMLIAAVPMMVPSHADDLCALLLSKPRFRNRGHFVCRRYCLHLDLVPSRTPGHRARHLRCGQRWRGTDQSRRTNTAELAHKRRGKH